MFKAFFKASKVKPQSGADAQSMSDALEQTSIGTSPPLSPPNPTQVLPKNYNAYYTLFYP